MKTIIVDYIFKTDPIKVNVERELMWYDVIKKEMQHFTGGQLVYEYKYDDYLEKLGYENSYRLLPKVVELKGKSDRIISNKNKILKWFKSYMNYNDSEIEVDGANRRGVVFNVPDNEEDDFSYQLERNGFKYF